MVVSGAPDRTKYHAIHICDMALDMVEAMTGLRDPSSKGNMKIRVGKIYCIICHRLIQHEAIVIHNSY